MSKAISIKVIVPGFHYWPDAPREVEFLRTSHRHLFHIRVIISVSDTNRQREFFIEQRRLLELMEETWVRNNHNEWLFNMNSCEMIAERILSFDAQYIGVEVYEDDENGGLIWK